MSSGHYQHCIDSNRFGDGFDCICDQEPFAKMTKERGTLQKRVQELQDKPYEATKHEPQCEDCMCLKQVPQVLNPKDVVALDKLPISVFPPVGTLYGAMACADGARKYGPMNWRETPIRYTSYLSAILRHVLSLMDGEDEASDSQLHHLAHVLATAAIVLDAKEHGTLIDDRPKNQRASSRIIDQYRSSQLLKSQADK